MEQIGNYGRENGGLALLQKVSCSDQGELAKENMSYEDWELLNRQVVWFIRKWVDDSIYHNIAKETKATSLWINYQEETPIVLWRLGTLKSSKNYTRERLQAIKFLDTKACKSEI